MKRKFLTLAAVFAALILCLTACGKDGGEQISEGDGTLGLTKWNLTAETWSSPNGATIHLAATPLTHGKDHSALFLVRLEGEEVDRAICQWEDNQYTASLDLNAANGYCYYLAMSNGKDQVEIPVNTPKDPVDLALIDLQSSLEASCSLAVESSEVQGNTLNITKGEASIRLPRIRPEGLTCTSAVLELRSGGEIVGTYDLTLPQPDELASYNLDIQGASFSVAVPEDGQQIFVQLTATLSNGQMLSAEGSSWLSSEGSLVQGVG